MMQTEFVYIWKYIVKEENIDEFISAYGVRGDWVRLFNKNNDYIQTKLFRSEKNKSLFITLDYWNNKVARDQFIKSNQFEYDEIDKRCEEHTVTEDLVGEYSLVN